MAKVIDVQEYKDEGFAIIEDTKGRFLVTKDNPDIIPLDQPPMKVSRHQPCYLLRNRDAMLT
jgi:hypothetical protein